VDQVSTDETGCAWVDLSLNLAVGEREVTDCTARIALPKSGDDNPWKRKEDRWKP
jgi:hypothetical protein